VQNTRDVIRIARGSSGLSKNLRRCRLGTPFHYGFVGARFFLVRFRRPDGLPYARKTDGGGQIKTAFKAACRRAGISDFTPHDCRHSWATWHYAQNRDLVGLMHLGGWSSERMVLRYAHMNVAQLASSIAALPWEKSGKRGAAEPKTEMSERG
jgi:integrase